MSMNWSPLGCMNTEAAAVLLVRRYMDTATGAEPLPSWVVRTTGGDAAGPADKYRTPPQGVVR